MVAKMTPFIERLNQLPGVSAKVCGTARARHRPHRHRLRPPEIPHDHGGSGLPSATGYPAIYCRGYKANEGHIEIDVRSVTLPQLDQIHSAIAHLVQENN